jgi:hypothetical protein
MEVAKKLKERNNPFLPEILLGLGAMANVIKLL